MAELTSMTSSRPARRFDWSNLGVRVASATVLIPAVVAAVWFGGALFLLMVALAVSLLALEWGKMTAPAASGRIAVAVAVAVLAAVFGTYLGWSQAAWLIAAAGAAGAAAYARTIGQRPMDVAFGVIYFAPACIAITWLRGMPQPISWTILLFAVTWSADIFAFLGGSVLKGPKLWPRFSPNKTWSGFFAGLVGAAAAAAAVAAFSTAKLSLPAAIVVGLVGGLATMAGDLWESMLKRRFGVKDSGDLIPGHGGLLDRVDGLMFAVMAICAARLVSYAGWGH